MSLVFNDTSTYKGIVQIYEKECGFNPGDISGNTDRLKHLTADVNLALDSLFEIGFRSSGTWQLDDSSHANYPIITTNIVSGQRDYSFTVDGGGNLILDIHKVLVADGSGYFREITSIDQQTLNSNGVNTDTLTNGQNQQGVPTRYDKTGNGIFLDLVPNYNYSGGLKMYVNREPSYFVYTDTTKKAGIPGSLHDYLALKPAREYARRNILQNANRLDIEVIKLERKIESVFGRREKDTKKRLFANVENTK